MPYELTWDRRPEEDLDLVEVIDPVMAAEIRTAADLFASSPFSHGVRVKKPFYSGLELRFLVRDHIRVRLNFSFRPGRDRIAVRRMLINRMGSPLTT
jgi:hypothetical protein